MHQSGREGGPSLFLARPGGAAAGDQAEKGRQISSHGHQIRGQCTNGAEGLFTAIISWEAFRRLLYGKLFGVCLNIHSKHHANCTCSKHLFWREFVPLAISAFISL